MKREPDPEEIPSGVCECGCGEQTPTSTYTARKRRRFEGHPAPYVPGHAPRPKRPRRPYVHEGYRMIYAPDHPNAQKSGYALEQRVVLSEKLGRTLEPHEIAHHINEDSLDNRPENLELMTGQGEHHTEHDHAAFMRAFHRQNPGHAQKMVAARKGKVTKAQISAAGRKGAAARWGNP